MKRLAVLLTIVVGLGLVAYSQGFNGSAGRRTFTMTTNTTIQAAFSVPVRVASVSLCYPEPVSGSIQLFAVQGSNQYCRASNTLTGVKTWVCVPDRLWVMSATQDKLVIVTTINTNVVGAVDYEY